MVTDALGQKPPKNPRTDVNGDGAVDGKDLALVAEHLDERAASAAPFIGGVSNADVSREMVERALDILRVADDGSLTFRRGIANLELLLTLFIPEETALLHNYPNHLIQRRGYRTNLPNRRKLRYVSMLRMVS